MHMQVQVQNGVTTSKQRSDNHLSPNKYLGFSCLFIVQIITITENANIAGPKDLTGKRSVGPVENLFRPVKFDKIYNRYQWVVAFLWYFGPVNVYSYLCSLQL